MTDCLGRVAYVSGAEGKALGHPTSYNLRGPAVGQTKNGRRDEESPSLHISGCEYLISFLAFFFFSHKAKVMRLAS